ncbi:MAG: NUDIX domain-containing protein [Candidatus Hodarchaeales archaeon]|jgi:ADP-ribose pyrophosphatase
MKINKITNLHSSSWLSLKEASYTNKLGQDSTWQYVERVGNPVAVTMIVRSVNTGYILLIRQHRVPIDAEQIEFPAGLVDDGETIEEAALRELKEETGYEAKVEKISPLLPKSAGLTNEVTTLVFCSTDETNKVDSEMEIQEDISKFWIDPNEFFTYVQSLNNIKIAIEVYVYFLGVHSTND